jgi:hypothetical protein
MFWTDIQTPTSIPRPAIPRPPHLSLDQILQRQRSTRTAEACLADIDHHCDCGEL